MAIQTPANRAARVPGLIELHVSGQTRQMPPDKVFVLGCLLLQKGHAEHAAKIFERLVAIPGFGPPASIMWACCEAAAKHFDRCTAALTRVFGGAQDDIAEALYNAFVSYYVGLRQEALETLVDLANRHKEVPALCLLLGELLLAGGKEQQANKCWRKALHRDRTGGPVAAVAQKRLGRAAT